ncbi:hypothetical protein VF21_08243 [Pseudogymnoascus sp. 05NY08]|nr:hypothetical protein VF21_08243 [Pseudogymnoascus sp. 05NY08]
MRRLLRTLFHLRRPTPATMTAASSGTLAGVALAAYTVSASVPIQAADAPTDAKNKTHHNKSGTGFINPWESWKPLAPLQIVSNIIWRRISGIANTPVLTPPLTLQTPTFLPSRTASTSLRATWLGHACMYLEFPSGLRVLLDPVFEDRCSPAGFPGPKRYTPTPCGLGDLPVVDVVVISHSHYDHLSYPSVMELAKLHPKALFAVPLGLESWFRDAGIQSVVEMDWWQEIDVTLSPTAAEGVEWEVTAAAAGAPVAQTAGGPITARISCLPCQHTSARTPFDQAKTLWASWAIKSGGKSVWFGGDTGYRTVPKLPPTVDDYSAPYADLPRCPAFKDIGKLRGPFDLGLIPIGAYDPRYLFSSMHADPADAVEIMKDTGCKRALGVHWGTWVLTEEDGGAPPRRLKEVLRGQGMPEVGVFDVSDVGESKEY